MSVVLFSINFLVCFAQNNLFFLQQNNRSFAPNSGNDFQPEYVGQLKWSNGDSFFWWEWTIYVDFLHYQPLHYLSKEESVS
jgi:membrane associated rhomboid family serine protease